MSYHVNVKRRQGLRLLWAVLKTVPRYYTALRRYNNGRRESLRLAFRLGFIHSPRLLFQIRRVR